ncbi:DNA polymerase alpha/epsilon subunit B-domain-containing protein [Amanita rubescens]|nr:DNA polymerase alpha/epsilon subunit B-domain-containing protein [Amanita rubescens]
MTAVESLNAPPTLIRASSAVLPLPDGFPSFAIDLKERSYRHQYANIYFIRLHFLRGFVEESALNLWKGLDGDPVAVPRVLEVTKGQLCYIIGTVYMDMPLKPNVLEDIARDQALPALPPPEKYYSEDDNIMLEDESGRIKLVGERLKDARIVTGVIMGALGMETPNGEFEVLDYCFAEMPSQPAEDDVQTDEMEIDADDSLGEWIAIVSGLDIGSDTTDDSKIHMLAEYLTGEVGGTVDQKSTAQISRLIVAGNSLVPIIEQNEPALERRPRRQIQDIGPISPQPILNLSAHLYDIAQTIPVHLLPGENDPSGMFMPQQPFPRAMFGEASKLLSFHCETNPTYMHLQSGQITRTLLINSGQPLNDMFRYLPSPPNTRIDVLESTLRWRHMAPTAPDTLWCHPYFTKDPFIIPTTPDLYIVGCQKRFGTRLVKYEREEHSSKLCRIVMVPNFSETGLLVLVNVRTLDVKTINFTTEDPEMSDDAEIRE